jgi:uncharacterized RmlC-like cupin family protein
MWKRLLTITVTFLLSSMCWGWGREGHQIIATVAEEHLNETTKVMIQSLIGNNHLYSIAAWADEIQRERPETGPWHYVNIPLHSPGYDAQRDCSPPRSCVVEKIRKFSRILVDKSASREQRAEALKFLVHFVADIHQPLHAVKEAKGGNDLRVQFMDSNRCGRYSCNLHGVWDTSMILYTGLKRAEYLERLESRIKAQNLAKLAGGTPEQWANESLQVARKVWVQNGANLDDTYFNDNSKHVDQQMALAGLRLAALLNSTLGKVTPADFR